MVAAIKDAENTKYDQYKINLLPGDYNVTQDMVWENSATRNIIINGNNNTLDGQGKYQFLRTGNSHDLTVENITFANFKVTKTDEDDNVPGNGGVFYINGKLIANNVRFINNYAIKRGGAIYNYGTVILNNTIFENNVANRYDGGIIANYGPLTISNSIFKGNTATDQGGAIWGDIAIYI